MTEGAKRFYPVFLDLARRLVRRAGRGPGGREGARQLVRYGADVVVIAPSPSEELLEAEAGSSDGRAARLRARRPRGRGARARASTAERRSQRAAFARRSRSAACVNVSGMPELSASSSRASCTASRCRSRSRPAAWRPRLPRPSAARSRQSSATTGRAGSRCSWGCVRRRPRRATTPISGRGRRDRCARGDATARSRPRTHARAVIARSRRARR